MFNNNGFAQKKTFLNSKKRLLGPLSLDNLYQNGPETKWTVKINTFAHSIPDVKPRNKIKVRPVRY